MGSTIRVGEKGLEEIQTKTGWKYKHAIKEEELLKDDIVYDCAEKILKLRSDMKALSLEIRDSIKTFVALMSEKYEVKIGGPKGGISLTSIDGRYRIQLSSNGRIYLDDAKMAIAKELINEMLDEITKDSNQDLKILVNSAFRTDSNGSFNVRDILALRRLNISNEKWAKAMDIIADGIVVEDGRPYLRLYECNPDVLDSKPEMVVMDFSGM